MGRIILTKPDLIAEDGDGNAIEAGERCVWVEWIGQPSPMHSPTVRHLMLGRRLPIEKKRAIRHVATNVIVRVDGSTSRTLRRGNGYGQIPQFSQEFWRWGPGYVLAPNGKTRLRSKQGQPGSYIQKMPYRDADALLSSVSGKEFRIIGYGRDTDDEPIEVVTNALLHAELFRTPEAVRLGAAEGFKTYDALSKSMGWNR